MQDLICCTSGSVEYRNTRNLSMEGVIEMMRFCMGVLDRDAISFRHDALVGIGIFYLAIKC
jgi:hypothetical protein